MTYYAREACWEAYRLIVSKDLQHFNSQICKDDCQCMNPSMGASKMTWCSGWKGHHKKFNNIPFDDTGIILQQPYICRAPSCKQHTQPNIEEPTRHIQGLSNSCVVYSKLHQLRHTACKSLTCQYFFSCLNQTRSARGAANSTRRTSIIIPNCTEPGVQCRTATQKACPCWSLPCNQSCTRLVHCMQIRRAPHEGQQTPRAG